MIIGELPPDAVPVAVATSELALIVTVAVTVSGPPLLGVYVPV